MEVRQSRSLHKNWIDRHAHEIVKDLQEAGYASYLVGGCVRDLLAGHPPKDFDIVTNATPEQVKKRVRNAYIIGKRFRLVLVHRYKKKFEVATFRREATPEELAREDGPSGDNLFGSQTEDAQRRDFTINAIFYDCVKDEVIDYINGVGDVENCILRMIGDSDKRLLEDPIRILRALRLSHKLSFTIEPQLRADMQKHATSLLQSALPRRREELLKIIRLSDVDRCLVEAFDLDIIKAIYPTLQGLFENHKNQQIFTHYLQYKERVLSEEPTPSEEFTFFLFAYLRAVVGEDGKSIQKYLNFDENTSLRDFLRDELGMFRAEMDWVRKLFIFLEQIRKFEDPDKMPRRRRNHYLSTDVLPMALKLAEVDYLLDSHTIAKWWGLLKNHKPHDSKAEI